MDREELDLAVEGNYREYYDYLFADDTFLNVIEKVKGKEELSEEEWLYILERLFIIRYKSVQDEEKIDFKDKFNSLICRIGMKIFKDDSGLYNECLKMYKLIEFMKNEKEINKDLYNGYEIVKDNKDIESLNILINQYIEANIFKSNSSFYEELFEESTSGIISTSERTQMNASTYSYNREKELVKRYQNVI